MCFACVVWQYESEISMDSVLSARNGVDFFIGMIHSRKNLRNQVKMRAASEEAMN